MINLKKKTLAIAKCFPSEYVKSVNKFIAEMCGVCMSDEWQF